ncbi:snaclec bothroinsularin subunit beta-like [Patiria miniata]|uniref:C-type lectin domain-containing protein n=1 Tax=Patiria miniata TaxID=46514 RepID=A0A914A412_PATMI|nr:snaclec bothroinsularin subunit beta-like [Patiria miniata]
MKLQVVQVVVVAALMVSLCRAYTAKREECPLSWQRFEDSCYSLIQHTQNWNCAEMTCQQLGGHLVSIESGSENTFVVQMIASQGGCKATSHVWNGLSDIATEGTFVWSETNQPFVFNGFGSGQPDNYNNNEDCTEIHGGTWNDLPCSKHACSVCEMPVQIITQYVLSSSGGVTQ